jgi:hypothetical protein
MIELISHSCLKDASPYLILSLESSASLLAISSLSIAALFKVVD